MQSLWKMGRTEEKMIHPSIEFAFVNRKTLSQAASPFAPLLLRLVCQNMIPILASPLIPWYSSDVPFCEAVDV